MVTQHDIFRVGGVIPTESPEIKYRIYPSMLDKFQSLLDYEEEAEAPWNKWSQTSIERARIEHQNRVTSGIQPLWYPPTPGDYILTPEEMYEKIERELIDTINREPHDPSEAADRGTALNEVIDCLILNKPCERKDMTIESQRVNGTPISIRVDYDGFTFNFDIDLCIALRGLLQGSVCQYQLSAPIQTSYGLVELYGYLDYWLGDNIIDLKTTSAYDFGKYERKWQKCVYPYCAIESGLTDKVSNFTYLVAQLGKGQIIKGKIYPEIYSYNHADCVSRLTAHVEDFIRWLESKRNEITDRKIFNLPTETN